jgi:hypothetical protein
MKLHKGLTGVLAVLGLLAAGQASAAFATGGYCSTSTATGGISVTNLTLNNNNANDCYGLVSIGGDVANEIGNINDLGWGTYSASNYLKDDQGGSVTQDFLGLRWTLAANNGSNNSVYTLTVQDLNLGASPNLPFTVDIVAFLKAGTPGAFYFFDDAVIDTSNGGTFQIVWTNNGGQNPGLSGLSLFVGQSPVETVPEPGSLALLGIGLLGLAGFGRRFKR